MEKVSPSWSAGEPSSAGGKGVETSTRHSGPADEKINTVSRPTKLGLKDIHFKCVFLLQTGFTGVISKQTGRGGGG